MPVTRNNNLRPSPSTTFRSKRGPLTPSAAPVSSLPTFHQLYLNQPGPWQHMAHTYAWMAEQELAHIQKKNKETELWVLSQQTFSAPDSKDDDGKPSKGGKKEVSEDLRRRMIEELMYAYEIEAEKWMKREAEARRLAIEREKERKARIAQEEARRVHARQRRDQERSNRIRVSEREDRAKADKRTLDAWKAHETEWAGLSASSGPVTFRNIPWPVVSSPHNPAGLTPAAIVMFLFSPLHSQGQSRKERIRSALLRWHPDRFRRLLSRVGEAEKASVEEGVGIVARCLNDLMARETSIANHSR